MNQQHIFSVHTMANSTNCSSPSLERSSMMIAQGPAEVTPHAGSKRSLTEVDVSSTMFPSLPDAGLSSCARYNRSPSVASESSSASDDSFDAAVLLAAMKNIASREISNSAGSLRGSATHTESLSIPDLVNFSIGTDRAKCPKQRSRAVSVAEQREDIFDRETAASPASSESSTLRSRAVSFDGGATLRPGVTLVDLTQAAAVSASSDDILSPVTSSPPPAKEKSESVVHTYLTPTGKRKKIEGPAKVIVSPRTDKDTPHRKPKGELKTILRRKFSWKNYPELESFLVANREEYLRHSTLNYTVQQKQFNNRLTEQLIELAEEHGYVFDSEAFSFVTIRDRIRCYFKSYVQSSKKRGVIIGYAAKRAGLLTDKDLETSAGTAGKIIVPT